MFLSFPAGWILVQKVRDYALLSEQDLQQAATLMCSLLMHECNAAELLSATCYLSTHPDTRNMLAAGVEKVHSLPGGLSSYEQDALKKCMPELASSIQKGIDFAKAG